MCSFSARPRVGFVDALLCAPCGLLPNLSDHGRVGRVRKRTVSRLKPPRHHDGNDSIGTRTDGLATSLPQWPRFHGYCETDGLTMSPPRGRDDHDFMSAKTDGFTMNSPRDHDGRYFAACKTDELTTKSVT